jgi:hypothetical protein
MISYLSTTRDVNLAKLFGDNFGFELRAPPPEPCPNPKSFSRL